MVYFLLLNYHVINIEVFIEINLCLTGRLPYIKYSLLSCIIVFSNYFCGVMTGPGDSETISFELKPTGDGGTDLEDFTELPAYVTFVDVSISLFSLNNINIL